MTTVRREKRIYDQTSGNGDTSDKKHLRYIGQYADIYHLRGGKLTEHWRLALDPKVDEAFFTS